jgi:hypothetical protein
MMKLFMRFNRRERIGKRSTQIRSHMCQNALPVFRLKSGCATAWVTGLL